jgi:YD repeat-containing protein
LPGPWTYTYPNAGGGAGSKPHAVTQVANSGGSTVAQKYTYDSTGNMLCRPASAVLNTCPANGGAGAESAMLTWNSEGRLAKSTDKTGDTTFVYDADGTRLIRRDPAGSTLYLPGGTEIWKPKAGAATGTRYYTHGDSTIAVRTAAGVNWIINDHQGTGSATVSNDKNLTANRRRSLPFGDVRGVAPTYGSATVDSSAVRRTTPG